MMERKPDEIRDRGECEVRVIHLERVERARQRAVSDVTMERLSSFFKTLGDPTRLRLVMALRDEEMCVCDLAALLGISESAVSHQLRWLREQRLVRSRREAQVVYSALADEHVTQLVDLGLAHVSEALTDREGSGQ